MSHTYTREQVSDLYLLALCIWRESRGEPYLVKRGVAWSIRNRVKQPRWWGKDWISVILKPWQYSSFNANDPNAVKIPMPDTVWDECLTAAEEAYWEDGTDPTDGATHYYDKSIAAPKWTEGATLTCTLGAIYFYKDVK